MARRSPQHDDPNDTRDDLEDYIDECDAKDPGFRERVEEATERRILAHRLRRRRAALGMSQRELAERIGTAQSMVSRVERGIEDIKISTLCRYLRALGLCLDVANLRPMENPKPSTKKQARKPAARKPAQKNRPRDATGRGKAKRSLFNELMAGVADMRAHREGKVTLRTCKLQHTSLPTLEAHDIKAIRERLGMTQAVFAERLRVNPRTLQRWEQGQSRPNEQAAALLLLVDHFPDTLERLDQVANQA